MTFVQIEAFTGCLPVGDLENKINEIIDRFITLSLSYNLDGIEFQLEKVGLPYYIHTSSPLLVACLGCSTLLISSSSLYEEP